MAICPFPYEKVSPDFRWSTAIDFFGIFQPYPDFPSPPLFIRSLLTTSQYSSVVVTQSYTTGTYTYVLPPPAAIRATPPCCGQCTLYAGTIDLFFWPTASETGTPSVTGLLPNQTAVARALDSGEAGSYVDDTGFTFVSPSIYIGFTSLGARDQCGDVGTAIYNTTMAFDPAEISSVLPATATATCITYSTESDGSVQNGTVMEKAEMATQALTYSDVAQNCSSVFGYYWFSENPYEGGAGDPCHPVLAIPTKVNELQKEWNDCGANYNGGFYDPPKTLKQGSLLVPTTADPKPTADPGQSPSTGAPPATTTKPTALPETTPDPQPSTINDPIPDPPSSTTVQSNPPVPTTNVPDAPNPPAPTTVQSNPPVPTTEVPDVPNPPAPTTVQSNPPVPTTEVPDVPNPPAASTVKSDPSIQPNPPQQGSSTTVIINPPPAEPTTGVQNPSNPGSPNLPVITLNPPSQPTTNNPSNPNPPSNPSNPPVLTLVPTVLPPPQNTANPQNPDSNAIPVPQPSGTAIIIGTQTLQPGSAITVGGSTSTLQDGQTTVVGGTQLVLDPQGTQVIVDGTSTVTIPPSVFAQPTAAPQSTESPVVVTLDSTTLTANSLTQFVVESSTLTVGGTVTAAGTTYVLTTNTDGSTMLVAGTDGISSVATVVPTSTSASGNLTSSSTSGAATPIESGPLEATGAASALKLDWALGGLFAVGTWALAMA
jgi:hypothetical protein